MTPETYCTLCIYTVPVFAFFFAIDFAISWTAQAWRSICNDWEGLSGGWQRCAMDYKRLADTWRDKAMSDPGHAEMVPRRHFFRLNKWDMN